MIRSLLLYIAGISIAQCDVRHRAHHSVAGRKVADRRERLANCDSDGFARTVPVPGLADMAEPGFKDVNLFDSRELISNRIRTPGSNVPESARVLSAGIPRQERNYFWYRRTFRRRMRAASRRSKWPRRSSAPSVWLNGKPVGEHAGLFHGRLFRSHRRHPLGCRQRLADPRGCASSGAARHLSGGNGLREAEMDARNLRQCLHRVRRQSQDRVRSGRAAHATSEILVQTKLINRGAAGEFLLRHSVRPLKGNQSRGDGASPVRVKLGAGEDKDTDRNDTNSRCEAVVARAPEPLPAGQPHRRRFRPHALWDARVSQRLQDEALLSQRTGALPARHEHHAAPFLRGS